MAFTRPRLLTRISVTLLIVGFAAAFAMSAKLIPPSFWLSFIACGPSFNGLILGQIGLALHH